jgi:hypothetical protein
MAMKIEMKPTGAFETFRGMQFRLFQGVTDKGVPVQFLGMFRVNNPFHRRAFAEELAAIPMDGSPTQMLKTPNLIAPDAEPARLKQVLEFAREKLRYYRENQAVEWIPGMEHDALMKEIDELIGPERSKPTLVKG